MAQKKQNTLVLFPDVITVTQKFTDEQFGILMRAAFSYRFYGEVYSGDDAALDVAFQLVSQQIDRYEGYRAAMSSNAKGSKAERSTAKGSKCKQKDPPYPYPISISNSISSIDIADHPQKRTVFIPPSVDEVRAYCQENGYQVDAEYFVDYYTAIDWMAGKNKMKDWKAAVRNWHRREQEKHPVPDKTTKTIADMFPPVPTL